MLGAVAGCVREFGAKYEIKCRVKVVGEATGTLRLTRLAI